MINSKTEGRTNKLDVVSTIEQVPAQLDTAQARLDSQPQFDGGFSTKSDPHQTQNEGMGVNMGDPHKLYNKILEKGYRDIIYARTPGKIILEENFNGFSEIGANGFKIKRLIS